MADSSTEKMDNFGTRTVEHHQMILNSEVMKHINIMNRTSVREIMLEHEKTFKEQVHDLHKLYEVQKSLMHKAKDRGKSMFYFGGSQLNTHNIQSLSEPHESLKQRINFWESTLTPLEVTESLNPVKERPFPELEKTIEGMDDLLKPQGDAGNATKVDSKNTNNSTKKKVIDLEQLPEDDSDDEIEKVEDVVLLPREPINSSSRQANFKLYLTSNNGMSAMSNSTSGESNVGTKPDAHSSCAKVQTVAGVGKTTLVQNESHVDLVCRMVGNETHWFYQGSDGTIKALSSDVSTQRQEKLSPSHVIAEGPLKDYHQYAQQGIKKLVAASNLVRNCTNPSAGSVVRFAASLETPEISSVSSTSETYFPGGQFSGVVPVLSSKGQCREPDKNIWYQGNSVMQFQPNQSQGMFGKPFANVNQSSFLQSSQNTRGGIYSQQGIYGAHVNDASHIGLQVGGLLINQVEEKGSRNLLDTGNYYPSCPQPIQETPPQKPSKLLFKNDADGIDLKEVTLEGQPSENSFKRKPTACFKKDSPQDLKFQEKNVCIQREETNGEEVMHEEGTGMGTLKNVLAMHMASTSHTQKDLTSKTMKEGCAVQYVSTAAKAAREHNFSCLVYEQSKPNSQFVEQTKMEGLPEDELKNNDKSKCNAEGNSACRINGSLEQANEDKQEFALSGQGSNLIPSKDGMHEESMTFDKSHICSEHVKVSIESTGLEGDFLLENDPAKGSCRKDDSARVKTLQAADLRSSNQLTLQAAGSMQSVSTEAPCITKVERECSSKELEGSAKGSSSSISRKRKPVAIMVSDDYENLPILPSGKPVLEYKEVVALDEWNDNLPHISDSDSLAASILLSFAPKKKSVESLSTYREDDVDRDFNNSKHGQSSLRHVIAAGPKISSLKSKDVESSDCRGTKEKQHVQCSLKKLDKKLDLMDFTLQEKEREDHRSLSLLLHNPRSELKIDMKSTQKGDLKSNQKNDPQNDVKSKILKVESKVSNHLVEDDEAVEAPRSRQLNKLNGSATLFPPKTSDDNHIHQQHSIGQKRKDAHPATGRRSCRGQPQHKPSSQYSEDSGNGIHPDDLEPTHFKPGGQSTSKAETGNKSKAWCDINKKGNRPPSAQSQIPGNPSKKTER